MQRLYVHTHTESTNYKISAKKWIRIATTFFNNLLNVNDYNNMFNFSAHLQIFFFINVLLTRAIIPILTTKKFF